MNPLRVIERFIFGLLDRLIGINEPEPQQLTIDEIMLGILIAKTKQSKENVQ